MRVIIASHGCTYGSPVCWLWEADLETRFDQPHHVLGRDKCQQPARYTLCHLCQVLAQTGQVSGVCASHESCVHVLALILRQDEEGLAGRVVGRGMRKDQGPVESSLRAAISVILL